jgi:S1-C subfamily serine protease
MYIYSRGLVSVLGIFSFVLSSFAFGQNYYALEAQAALSSVKIETSTATGMGVALEDGSTIATCAHVVGNNNWVDIYTGGFQDRGYVLSVDSENDIAIIRMEGKVRPFAVRTSTERIDAGTFVLAAGKPNKSSRIDMRPGTSLIYFTDSLESDLIISSAPEHGYSGGPVMDEDGRLVGIMKSYAGFEGTTGTAVIPTWKVNALIKRTRDDLNR